MHSFDVFDTCLVRSVADPDAMFFLAAESVLRQGGKEPTSEETADLARLRREALDAAWSASDREDVSLEAIYQQIDLGHWGISPRAMMQEELRLESEAMRPITKTLKRLEQVRARGQRVVFISDTPIPSGHLTEMLRSAGFTDGGDPVYTSGDLGLTKLSGSLFDHVQITEGVVPDDWIHHGDHPLSDIKVPKARGIAVEPCTEGSLTRYERALLDEGGGQSWARAEVAGVSRVARVTAHAEPSDSALVGLAAGVVAPLLTGFVAWVLQRAKEQGLDRLYFVSRDGDILLHIVEQLRQQMRVPECRYLYGSRRAWQLPAITAVNPDDLYWLLDERPTLSDLLAKLSLEPREVVEELRAHRLDESVRRVLETDELERFWSFVAEPEIESLVLSRANQARETTLAYLEQEGLTSQGDWALVDVGWKLRSQEALKRILDTVGLGDAVSGYYMAVASSRQPMSQTGAFQTLLMPEESDRARILLSRATVVEEAFLSADHGSVTAYAWDDGRPVPVFGKWIKEVPRTRYLARIREVVSIYAREALNSRILEDHWHLVWDGALRNANELLSHPTRAEARTVASFTAVSGSSHEETSSRPLASPLGVADALGQFLARNLGRLPVVQRYRRRPRRWFWEEGSLALSSPLIRFLYRFTSRLRLRAIVGPLGRIARSIHSKRADCRNLAGK